MVILLNILIALYNSAYEDITGNALDEYMALFAQKTMQYVRAPDENVFIPPLNLIEIFLLILPFEWWMPKKMYGRLNDYVMGLIYSPLLVVAALVETRTAVKVSDNRRRHEVDDGKPHLYIFLNLIHWDTGNLFMAFRATNCQSSTNVLQTLLKNGNKCLRPSISKVKVGPRKLTQLSLTSKTMQPLSKSGR